jgi:hypothetical protein
MHVATSLFRVYGSCSDANVTDMTTGFSMSHLKRQAAVLSFPIYIQMILCDIFI